MTHILAKETIVQQQRFDFLEIYDRISQQAWKSSVLELNEVTEAVDFFKDGHIDGSDYDHFIRWYPGKTPVSYSSFVDFARFARMELGSGIPQVGGGLIIVVDRTATAQAGEIERLRGAHPSHAASPTGDDDMTRTESAQLLSSFLDDLPDFFTDEHKATIQGLYDRVSPEQQDLLVDFFENFQDTNDMEPEKFVEYFEDYRSSYRLPLNLDLSTPEIFWINQNPEWD